MRTKDSAPSADQTPPLKLFGPQCPPPSPPPSALDLWPASSLSPTLLHRLTSSSRWPFACSVSWLHWKNKQKKQLRLPTLCNCNFYYADRGLQISAVHCLSAHLALCVCVRASCVCVYVCVAANPLIPGHSPFSFNSAAEVQHAADGYCRALISFLFLSGVAAQPTRPLLGHVTLLLPPLRAFSLCRKLCVFLVTWLPNRRLHPAPTAVHWP